MKEVKSSSYLSHEKSYLIDQRDGISWTCFKILKINFTVQKNIHQMQELWTSSFINERHISDSKFSNNQLFITIFWDLWTWKKVFCKFFPWRSCEFVNVQKIIKKLKYVCPRSQCTSQILKKSFLKRKND